MYFFIFNFAITPTEYVTSGCYNTFENKYDITFMTTRLAL